MSSSDPRSRNHSLATLNSDIVAEILSYFHCKVDMEDDAVEMNIDEYWEMRRDTLSLALVSRSLSRIALDALWRDMISLKPILKVIQAFEETPQFVFESQAPETRQGRWVTAIHSNFDTMLPRVESYLARIRHLSIANPNAEEYALWSALLVYLRLIGPLTPNLLDLQIDWDDARLPPIYPTLIPLLSSTIKRLELIAFFNPNVLSDPILHHLNMIGSSLQVLKLHGPCQKSTISALRSFSFLKDINIRTADYGVPSRTLFSLEEVFQALPNLEIVNLHLQYVQPDLNKPKLDIQHSLRSLDLTCLGHVITRFLASDISSGSLESLRISACSHDPPLEWCWKAICEGIMHGFPNLSFLHLRGNRVDTPNFTITDLEPLFGLLQELKLPAVEGTFSAEGVGFLLAGLPRLQTLDLGRSNISLEPIKVLYNIADHGSLEVLHIRLDLTDLSDHTQTGLIIAEGSLRKQTKLRRLHISKPLSLPSTLEQKTTLVQNLLALLPRLEFVSLWGQRGGDIVTMEIRTLLSAYKAAYRAGYRAREGEEGT